MHEKVFRLKTPEDCESFAKNVEEKYPDLAREARHQAVELKATPYGNEKESERDAYRPCRRLKLRCRDKNVKKTRASRTWQSIARWARPETVERVVCNRKETDADKALVDMDMADFTFESVVVGHPNDFNAETVACAQKRLATLQGGEHA